MLLPELVDKLRLDLLVQDIFDALDELLRDLAVAQLLVDPALKSPGELDLNADFGNQFSVFTLHHLDLNV
jgi:hypothetical protein